MLFVKVKTLRRSPAHTASAPTNALAAIIVQSTVQQRLTTCAVLLAGYLLFDAAPNSRVLGGATTAMSSLCAYAWLKLRDTRQKQMTEKQLLELLNSPRPPTSSFCSAVAVSLRFSS